MVIIVIPVYKVPDSYELLSLRRCCEVLYDYKMTLVCPNSLDTTIFHDIWSEYNLKLKECRFDDEYFYTVAGYNKLLLSECFYSRFKEYEYMLIYQADAYVFEDKLSQWCSLNYDYVGAPLFGDFSDTEFYYNKSRVGNGGFSLRRVRAFLDFFSGKKHVFKTASIASQIGFWEKPYTRWLIWLLMVLGWKNTPASVAKHWKYNEDDFWSGLLDDTNYAMKKPSVNDALAFAFERFPSECYAITGNLPFGCHAWRKYEYFEFWKYYIK